MKYTTLLMDADDTIFDFPECEYNALKNAFTKNGFDFTQTLYEKFSEINDSLWKKFEKGEIKRSDLRVERFKLTCEYFDMCSDITKITVLADTYVNELSQQAILIDGAYDALEKISRICDIYIITNGLSVVQRGRFGKSPVTKFLKDIFISDETGVQKPQKEFFDIVFEKIPEKDKSKILVVGDSLTSDMQGGKNAGLDTCIYDPKNKISMPNDLCDYKITSLIDVCNIIKGTEL